VLDDITYLSFEIRPQLALVDHPHALSVVVPAELRSEPGVA
jgi:hypothetical protein